MLVTQSMSNVMYVSNHSYGTKVRITADEESAKCKEVFLRHRKRTILLQFCETNSCMTLQICFKEHFSSPRQVFQVCSGSGCYPTKASSAGRTRPFRRS